MLEGFIDFIALILAVDAVLTAWFYGSIFDNWRERLQDKSDKSLLAYLLTCTLCLPYHVSFWIFIILWIPAQLLVYPYNFIPKTIIYSFAVTDIVHWLQGVRPIPEEIEEEIDDS